MQIVFADKTACVCFKLGVLQKAQIMPVDSISYRQMRKRKNKILKEIEVTQSDDF